MTRDAADFTRDRMTWLEGVLSDPGTPPSGFQVAFAITCHLNRRTGEAYPSHTTIARRINKSPRQVNDLLAGLRDRGHLQVQRRPNKSNVYRLVHGAALQPVAVPKRRKVAVPEQKLTPEPSPPAEVQLSVSRDCSPPLTNSLKEPCKDIRGPEKAEKRAHRLPKDWSPPADAYEFGERFGLTTREVEWQTEKFRDHYAASGKAWADWAAAWRSWIRKAVEFKGDRKAEQSGNMSWAKRTMGE